jgi:hypothetical protein
VAGQTSFNAYWGETEVAGVRKVFDSLITLVRVEDELDHLKREWSLCERGREGEGERDDGEEDEGNIYIISNLNHPTAKTAVKRSWQSFGSLSTPV